MKIIEKALLALTLGIATSNGALADEARSTRRVEKGGAVHTRAADCSDAGSYTANACRSYDSTDARSYYTGDTSRYSTSQGWSRAQSSWWWGNRSDLSATGYTPPARRR